MASSKSATSQEPTQADWDRMALTRTKHRRSWTSSTLNTVARLAIWYSLITLLFRCPSSPGEVSEASPQICKPYLVVRSYVTPYLEPYYTTYAAPYVEKARPYTDTFHEKIYTPGAAFTKQKYERYGEPTVAQLQAYSENVWVRVVKPRLDTAQAMVWKEYQKSLAPHVNRASDVVQPQLANAQAVAVDQFQNNVVPSYQKAQPYAQNAYNRGLEFATGVLLPYGRWIGETVLVFIQRRVWPPIRIAYGENVQPQLLKIRERLANYRDGKRLEAAVEGVDRSSSSSTAVETFGASSSVAAKASVTASESATSNSTPEAEKTVQQKVTEDLKHWQTRFAKAADSGAEDLRERVSEISSSQIDSQVHGTAEALLVRLEEAASTSLSNLKKQIIHTVENLPEDSTDEDDENAKDQVRTSIRSSGNFIKEAAQKLRSWRRDYNKQLDSLVAAASESTLEVVDGIRDLGLQEIGMRWAAMDGVTHKDWNEYHALKKTVDKWRHGVERVVTEHEGLTKAKQEAEDVEWKGMGIAEDAAKELARLKEVIVWKIQARDSSNDFSSKVLPPAAAKIAKKISEKVSDASEAVAGTTSQGTVESLSSVASEGLDSTSSKAASVVEPVAESASSAQSYASSKASSIAAPAMESSSSLTSKLSSASSAASERQSSAESEASAMASPLSDSAASMASDATEPVSADTVSSIKSSVGSRAASVASASSASSSIEPAIEKLADPEQAQKVLSDTKSKPSSASEIVVSAISSVSSSIPKASSSGSATIAPSSSSFTAMADDVTEDAEMKASLSLASVVSEAGEGYASVTSSAGSVARKAAASA